MSPNILYDLIIHNYKNFHQHINKCRGGGHIKPTETFNLLVTLQGQKASTAGGELLGLGEIELALLNDEPVLNVKESNFPNVVLIDLSMNPADAVQILRSTPTTAVSKVVPIESVVRTRLDSILEKVLILAAGKVKSGDSFAVRCDVRGRRYIKSKEDLIDKISEQIVENLDLSPDGQDPDWVVQVEVVDENTGVSILKPHEILKKI